MKHWIAGLLFLICLGFSTQASASFTDVPENTSYKPAIDWALEQGIINGYEDGTFRPYNHLTEAQFLKMYVRLLDFKGIKDDVVPNYETYYTIANIYQLPSVNSSYSSYFSTKPITRGKVANLVAYAKGVGGADVQADSAYMMKQGYAMGQKPTGKTAADIFGAQNTLKRYHAVVFLYNAFKDDSSIRLKHNPYQSDLTLTGPETWTNKKYYFNKDTYYRIVSEGYADFEMELYYQDELVGGYYAGNHNEAFDVKIGESYESFLQKHPLLPVHITAKQTAKDFGTEYRWFDDYTIKFYMDMHENYKINGISWENNNTDYMKLYANDAFSNWKTGDYTDIELLFVEVLNAQRYQYGYAPVQYHRAASLVTRAHSVDLIEHKLFGHIGSDGSWFSERMQRKNPKNFIDYDEDVVGAITPYDGVHTFLNSFAGHRESLLSTYSIIAVGHAVRTSLTENVNISGITTVNTGTYGDRSQLKY